ncbi:MAG: 2,3-bisphosphoglycerate-independent phosphoglycerate mutase [Acidobacteriota bacterium]
MDAHQELLQRLSERAESKIVLLVLDGVGDLVTAEQEKSALEIAASPTLDRLAAEGSLGRLIPVAPGITPGSGPGHLGLFGYDPRRPEVDIGRGVLEAFGLGLTVGGGDIAARANFATANDERQIVDRRAGRISTEECERLVGKLRAALVDAGLDGEVDVIPGEGHRFVLIMRGDHLSAEIADTDPQDTGVMALPPVATNEEAADTAAKVKRVIEIFEDALIDEDQANAVLLRGFSKPPSLPSFAELYKLRAGAFAGYPLYRGVASACGMTVVECGKSFGELVTTVRERWDDFDFFFMHVKGTDKAGEDGDLAAKAAVIEEVDRGLDELLAALPDVVAVTGDHSTPAPMAAHSWHPIPLLVSGKLAFRDRGETFDEHACTTGTLGTMMSHHLIGVLLAHAGRLAKYGA